MLGDSITELWLQSPRGFFPGKSYVNKGISGNTTTQMLSRFATDVLDKNPGVVVIFGGINDLNSDSSASGISRVEANLASMIDAAQARGIRVVVASVLPVGYSGNGMQMFTYRRGEVNGAIRSLNSRIRQLAANRGSTFLDYYSSIADGNGELPDAYNADNVHLKAAAYDVMAPLAEAAISAAFSR